MQTLKICIFVYLLQIYKNMPISRGNVSIFNGFPRLIGVFCDFYPNMDEFPLSILYNYSCISATMKSILCRLTQTESGTDKELFNEQELNQFASFYLESGMNFPCHPRLPGRMVAWRRTQRFQMRPIVYCFFDETPSLS